MKNYVLATFKTLHQVNIKLDEILQRCKSIKNSPQKLYNPGQNSWHKVKKIGQDYKNLISNFVCFLTAFVKT